MKISTITADLIDAIANRELPVLWYGATSAPCVSTFIARGSDLDGLPRAGAIVREVPGEGYTVYWPAEIWNERVSEYVATIADASGVAFATPPGVMGD
jgi:hypothetical protein